VSGDLGMSLAFLEGGLESPPAINPDKYLQDLIASSPALKHAQEEADAAAAELARDKREAVPDVLVRAGAQQNRAINDFQVSRFKVVVPPRPPHHHPSDPYLPLPSAMNG